ncbi:hypothetical protein CKY39_16195 [Variovorax boronicumulans]|uniref:Uncharacterized protein n=1 Tax=Variovorax boronicumulans TaxID=436515 RepID=A0A250DJM3_9BURK|nr:hypothetical protein [Variovorax boronicumulans]ATA54577.1 hypothetical protein CKY39_16195 [Variovorax boronicumulans]
MKLVVKKAFSWAHRGIEVKDYPAGAKIEGADDDQDLIDLRDVGKKEGWVADDKSRAAATSGNDAGKAAAESGDGAGADASDDASAAQPSNSGGDTHSSLGGAPENKAH